MILQARPKPVAYFCANLHKKNDISIKSKEKKQKNSTIPERTAENHPSGR